MKLVLNYVVVADPLGKAFSSGIRSLYSERIPEENASLTL